MPKRCLQLQRDSLVAAQGFAIEMLSIFSIHSKSKALVDDICACFAGVAGCGAVYHNHLCLGPGTSGLWSYSVQKRSHEEVSITATAALRPGPNRYTMQCKTRGIPSASYVLRCQTRDILLHCPLSDLSLWQRTSAPYKATQPFAGQKR